MERKGICRNVGACSKANKIQIITDDDAEFICSECESELEPVSEKAVSGDEEELKKKKQKKLISLSVIALILLAIIGGFFALSGGDSKPAPVEATVAPIDSDSIKRAEAEALRIQDSLRAAAVKDSLAKIAAKPNEETPQTPPATTPPTSRPKDDGNGYGKVNLGYGVYTGDRKNGKPHGHGTIKYTARHKIVPSKDFEANPGDEFEGDFREGRVSGNIGYWKHDGDITGIKP